MSVTESSMSSNMLFSIFFCWPVSLLERPHQKQLRSNEQINLSKQGDEFSIKISRNTRFSLLISVIYNNVYEQLSIISRCSTVGCNRLIHFHHLSNRTKVA